MLPSRRNKILLGGGVAVASALVVVLLLRDGRSTMPPMSGSLPSPVRLSLADYDASAPAHRLNLLFIHHSCGGQLLAGQGDEVGTNCVYVSHPNGGDLRARLEQNS